MVPYRVMCVPPPPHRRAPSPVYTHTPPSRPRAPSSCIPPPQGSIPRVLPAPPGLHPPCISPPPAPWAPSPCTHPPQGSIPRVPPPAPAPAPARVLLASPGAGPTPGTVPSPPAPAEGRNRPRGPCPASPLRRPALPPRRRSLPAPGRAAASLRPLPAAAPGPAARHEGAAAEDRAVDRYGRGRRGGAGRGGDGAGVRGEGAESPQPRLGRWRCRFPPAPSPRGGDCWGTGTVLLGDGSCQGCSRGAQPGGAGRGRGGRVGSLLVGGPAARGGVCPWGRWSTRATLAPPATSPGGLPAARGPRGRGWEEAALGRAPAAPSPGRSAPALVAPDPPARWGCPLLRSPAGPRH